jgi:(S)-2-hydroxyglutarate dehydrogenase
LFCIVSIFFESASFKPQKTSIFNTNGIETLTMRKKRYDIVLIGGGIVGVSTAWQIKQRYPDVSMLLVEKETILADHQTGHNSGVVHAGVYYPPGSLKADFCKQGAACTKEFCREHNIPYEQCGKLLVATSDGECRRMDLLQRNCLINGIETRRLSAEALKYREPSIRGLEALFVPNTAITDYRKITGKMAELFMSLGGEIQIATEVMRLQEKADCVQIHTRSDTIEALFLVACGGLMADRLARMADISVNFRIVPFRGEYFRLHPRHTGIVKHLIYPIPDPKLPFLGVHLTRMIDGSVTVGPNAVLGWKREGYGKINFGLRDVFEMLTFPGFWKVIQKNLGSGLGEVRDSVFRTGYLNRIHKYCPGITLKDLLPYPAGIRAQAVSKDGIMIHDFLFAESSRSFHVCNAPSPAATAAIPIGGYLCGKIGETFCF